MASDRIQSDCGMEVLAELEDLGIRIHLYQQMKSQYVLALQCVEEILMKTISLAGNTQVANEMDKLKPEIEPTLQEIAGLDLACKSVIREILNDTTNFSYFAVRKLEAVIDYMKERLNIGNWREVPIYIRKTITIASYTRLLTYLRRSHNFIEDSKNTFKIIDFGITFGCPLNTAPKLLHECASILNNVLHQVKAYDLVDLNIEETTTSNGAKPQNSIVIEVIDCPSMENFYNNYIVAEKPVILDNCMKHWPALIKWKDQNYFIQLAGLRTVAVEVGSKYTDQNWTQTIMTIEEFVKTHIYHSNGPTGYLAQYQLFDQIPELKEDIVVPDYCAFSDTNEAVDINAWYGPKGTVSPLHHDPKRNLLAQVIGEKQLFLFPPSDSELLYPHQHELLQNTAQVDPTKPDLEKHPKYKDAMPYYCILKPGQMLYIPPKWWHYVESLSISFSVSFWWQ